MSDTTQPTAAQPPDLPHMREKWTASVWSGLVVSDSGKAVLNACCQLPNDPTGELTARAIVESHNREIDRQTAETSALALVKRLADWSRKWPKHSTYSLTAWEKYIAERDAIESAACAMCPADGCGGDGVDNTERTSGAAPSGGASSST